MQPSLIRQPGIHFPSFLRGLHTVGEGVRGKASWVGDGCLSMTQRHLPSPCSSREQRQALQRPGLPGLKFRQHGPGQCHPRRGQDCCCSVSLLPPLLLSFASFAFLCLSPMLSRIFMDINEPFLFFQDPKESKLFVPLGNPAHATDLGWTL